MSQYQPRQYLRHPQPTVYSANLAMLFFVLLTLVFSGVLLPILRSSLALKGFFATTVGFYLLMILVEGLVLLPCALLAMRFMQGERFRALGVRKGLSPGQIAALLAIGWFAILFTQTANSLLLDKMQSWGYSSNLDVPGPANLGEVLLALLAIAVAPALCEELLFRGVVLKAYSASFSPAVGIIASSVLFGFMHGTPDQLVFAILFGVVLGLAVTITGSLWAGVIIHFLNNAFSVLVPLLFANMENPGPAPLMVQLESLLYWALFLTGLFFLLANITRKRKATQSAQFAPPPAEAPPVGVRSFWPLIIFLAFSIYDIYYYLLEGFGKNR